MATSSDSELRKRSQVERSPDDDQDSDGVDEGLLGDDDEVSQRLIREALSEGEGSNLETIRQQKEYLEQLLAEERARRDKRIFLDSVKFSTPRLLGVLLLVRFLNVFLVQTYYVADEYWQSLEVAHQMVFKYGYLTWEWKHELRGYTHPMIFAGVFKALQWFEIDHPMLLILFPRLLQGLFASLGDVYLYKLAQRLFGSETAYWVLLSYLTSWFVCYTATRTLSNTMEMILLIIALYYYPWPKDYLADKSKSFPNWMYLSVVAFAFIIRPTAAIVWFPFCVWHFIRAESKLRLIFLGYLPVGICAAAWSMGIDRIFYGKWVVVQYNFLKLNFFGDIGANYGSHPCYWYLLTGIPVVLGTHIFPFVFGIKKCWDDKKFRHLMYIMLWTVGVYSLLSHKEFRFLLSILPIAMFFCGHAMYNWSQKTTWGSFLILGLLITNLPLALYFGMLHQRGSMDVMPYLQNLCQNTREGNKLPTVTFLMPCHSTPYFSHLHYKVQMKFLDCSPNLKNKTDYMEEADRFYRNPKKWLATRYSNPKKQPTLLVFYSVLRPRIKTFLKDNDYQEVSKFFHTHFPEGRVGKKVLVYRKTPGLPPDLNTNFN